MILHWRSFVFRFREWVDASICKHAFFLAFADLVFATEGFKSVFLLWRRDRLRRLIPSRLKWSRCVVRLRHCAMYSCDWLQTASECFKLFHTVSNCFKPFHTVSNCFQQFQTSPNCFNQFKLLRTASNWFQLFPRKFRGASSCEARDTLLQAARDGRLASAFKEMRKASVSTVWLHVGAWCD